MSGLLKVPEALAENKDGNPSPRLLLTTVEQRMADSGVEALVPGNDTSPPQTGAQVTQTTATQTKISFENIRKR
ncbi:MAG: hypothetical protein LBJ14_00965 [Desulfarculales bacterium]|jgi:hypothetical protein|nr:hypothetical protein [Desulfarculales bacterium]